MTVALPPGAVCVFCGQRLLERDPAPAPLPPPRRRYPRRIGNGPGRVWSCRCREYIEAGG